ncbi:MAG: hypothetical protein C0415_06230 [Thermodesulfovibrio sp.]|nr:hypothetical protein [Thermodesulfovibrio sp.]
MLKKQLRISKYRSEKSEVRSQKLRHKKYCFYFLLFTIYCSLFTVSCATKHVEIPSYEKITINEALAELKKTTSIDAVLLVEYEKGDIMMSGDAALLLSENKLDLKLYYLGFLYGEVKEENGIVKSKPLLDKNKSILLVDGLKNSFFWWNIKDYTINEKEDIYELKNSTRQILISKKTMLPVQQIIKINNADELKISYDFPAKIKAEETNSSNPPLSHWYQSHLKIEFKKYLVRIEVKSYSITK